MVKSVLPRTIDVNRFAGARVQEVQQLVQHLESNGKLGQAVQSRNIRRRARSHRGRNRRFRVNCKKEKILGKKRKRENENQENREVFLKQDKNLLKEEFEVGNREMRRRTGNMLKFFVEQGKHFDEFQSRQHQNKCFHLETHIWHAKRFKMEHRWGYVFSGHLLGAASGSRSLLKKCRQGAVIHDASYWNPIQIQPKNKQHWETALQLLRDCLEEGEVLIKELKQFLFSAGNSVWKRDDDVVSGQVYYVVQQNNAQILLLIHPVCYFQVYNHLAAKLDQGIIYQNFGEMKLIQVLGNKADQIVDELTNDDKFMDRSFSQQTSRFKLRQCWICDPRVKKDCDGSISNKILLDSMDSKGCNYSEAYSTNMFDWVSRCPPPPSDNIINSFKSKRRKQLFAIQEQPCSDSIAVEIPVLVLSQLHNWETYQGLKTILLLTPAGWGRIFWNELNIARDVVGAAGQLELRWIYTNYQQLCFPYDFPDFEPYSPKTQMCWNFVGKSVQESQLQLKQKQQQLQFEKKTTQRKIQNLSVQNLEEIDISIEDIDLQIPQKPIVVRQFQKIKQIFECDFALQWQPVACKIDEQHNILSQVGQKFVCVSVSVVGKGKCQEGSLLICKKRGLVVGFITSASVVGGRNYPGGLGVVSLECFAEFVDAQVFQLKCSLINQGSEKLRTVNVKLLGE